MDLILFSILYFVFWIIYYAIESYHDANVILWNQVTYDRNATQDKRDLAQKYSTLWHDWDGVEKGLVHIVITAIVFLLGGNIWICASLLLLSLSIRFLVHDYLINIFLGVSASHIGTTHWIDIFMRKLESIGISQWVVKFTLLFISIILVLIFLFI